MNHPMYLMRPEPEEGKPILVAVYGTLRNGGGLHHHYLSDVTCLGKGKISHAQIYCLGGCPGAIQRPEMPEAKIVVEIYEIDEDILRQLDQIEGFYDRVLVNYVLDNGDEGKAFLYTITDEDLFDGMSLIPDGDWMESDLSKWTPRRQNGGVYLVPKPKYVMQDDDGNWIPVPKELEAMVEAEIERQKGMHELPDDQVPLS